MLSTCPDCDPGAYKLCAPHDAFVTALYTPCDDPACPVCA